MNEYELELIKIAAKLELARMLLYTISSKRAQDTLQKCIAGLENSQAQLRAAQR